MSTLHPTGGRRANVKEPIGVARNKLLLVRKPSSIEVSDSTRMGVTLRVPKLRFRCMVHRFGGCHHEIRPSPQEDFPLLPLRKEFLAPKDHIFLNVPRAQQERDRGEDLCQSRQESEIPIGREGRRSPMLREETLETPQGPHIIVMLFPRKENLQKNR